ncbi:unnamed protein product [Leptosia nina]|uniref:MADF domain-containing protein n=1 Tax=Leptosia nina TaxID=320188 RepID=A0AAV1JA41_9NEOP
MSFENILNKVKEHPVLWDTGHKYYKQKTVQGESWALIASELDVEEKLVRNRWKYLKDQCRKELKKIAAGEIDKSRWQYFEQLHFLTKYLEDGKSKQDSDYEPPRKVHKSESPEPSTSEPESRKLLHITNKLNELSRRMDNQNPFDEELRNDPDFMFLMSILPTIRTLTDVQKFTFRGKVNEWLLEALAQTEFILNDQYECKYEASDS